MVGPTVQSGAVRVPFATNKVFSLRQTSRPERKTRGANPAVKAEESAAGSSALQKGFALLEHLIAADRALALAELVAAMGVPKATVHRLLINLEAAQLLRRDLTGKRYVPGDRLTRFSLRAVVFSARMSPVLAILERLVAEIGESVNLGVLDGSSVAYVQRVECNWPLRTHLSAGSRVPLHCTATGKLFLALMPTTRRAALLDEIELRAYAPNTITDRKRLDAELARIRDERLAVNNEEFMVGAIGLSVPLIGVDGEMIAGLALHAPVARLSVDNAGKHASTLRRAAEKLARTLL
jgi:IclR family transcriptional regulator, acetate operon repressor